MISLIVFSIIGVVGLVLLFIVAFVDDFDFKGVLALICLAVSIIGLAVVKLFMAFVLLSLLVAAFALACILCDGSGKITFLCSIVAAIGILVYSSSAYLETVETDFKMTSEKELTTLWSDCTNEEAGLYVEKVSSHEYLYRTLNSEADESGYEKVNGDVRIEESDDYTKPVIKTFEKEIIKLRENKFTNKIYEKKSGTKTYYVFEIPVGSCKN